MPRVTYFELHADDPERVLTFYQNVFEWQSSKWEGPFDYWFLKTGDEDEPGINGAVLGRTYRERVNISINVPSIEECIDKIIQAGGKVLMEKFAVPGAGYKAYCEDTEGNVFALMQLDKSAQ